MNAVVLGQMYVKTYFCNHLHDNNPHCDQVNDFPLIKGTPGIIHDPIDLLEVRFQTEVHCKYLRPNYDQIAAYGRTTTVIPWFQPLVVGCQSIFIVDIGIKEKYRIQY